MSAFTYCRERYLVSKPSGLIQFNSIQFFIINVPSQNQQGQLQTQHSIIITMIIIFHTHK
jgi:hypothetical protein